MNINPYLFILARPPHQVVWNYKTHTQYELNEEYSKRLAELICNPSLFNSQSSMDREFLNSGIISQEQHTPPDWKWDDLSKIFHIGTKDIPCENEPKDINEWASYYLTHCNEILEKPIPTTLLDSPSKTDLIPLPTPSPANSLKASLYHSLISRKTCRSFTEGEIPLSDLSILLYISLGYLKEREPIYDPLIPEAFQARRSSPSSGGLNACDGYIYARKVAGIDPGIYRYHPKQHALTFTGPIPAEPLGRFLASQHFINTLPLGLFLTCRFDKLWWKYEHSRVYRMAYVEAGHISQTFQLVATSLGLNTWLTGAMADEKVECFLGVKTPEEVLLFVGCGKSNTNSQCDELRTLTNKRRVR